MSKKRKNRKSHMGSSIDDFLKEEGIFEEAQARAVKEVVAWQLDEAMRKRKISKNKMATLLKTSRTRAVRFVGRSVRTSHKPFLTSGRAASRRATAIARVTGLSPWRVARLRAIPSATHARTRCPVAGGKKSVGFCAAVGLQPSCTLYSTTVP